MKLRSSTLAFWTVLGVVFPHAARGSIAVVYFTPEKIVVASESRLSANGSAPIDTGCKVTALDGRIVAASIGLVKGPTWDSSSLLHDAYSRNRAETTLDHVAATAEGWSESVALAINRDVSAQPRLLRFFIDQLGRGASIAESYIGGFSATGRLSLIYASISPDPQERFVEAHTRPVPTCRDHNFCAMGNQRDLDVITEFTNLTSDRARKEVAEWRPPRGTAPSDYDAFRTMRILEIAIQKQAVGDAGGPIDAVQLNRDGSRRWYRRKSNCLEN